MKKDPHKNKEAYLKWQESNENGTITRISKANSDLMKQFLNDMEIGMNVALGSKKGARSYPRLRALKDKMLFFSRQFKEYFKLEVITDIKEEQLHFLLSGMRNGKIKRGDGQAYRSVKYYAKDFKSFWHWYMRVQKKKGAIIPDITVDIDTTGDKPPWVYLSEEQVKKLCDNALYDYKVLMMFLFDSGIRSPTELLNVMITDFHEDFKKVVIREETSKTFGRKINLMISSELIKEYIQRKGLKETDYLFQIMPATINKYLKRLAKKVLGEGKSLAGEPYASLTMYDFRHSSACYWLVRYKSESAMKYRFGWKKSDMIHYYTELLGMKDTICEEDLLVDVTKTEIEQQLIQSRKREELIQEEMDALRKQVAEIQKVTNEIWEKMGMRMEISL